MPLNNTLAERELEANKQLADKIKLEQAPASAFRRLFKQMGRDLESLYSVAGRVPSANDYEDDIKAILIPHYQKVTNQFAGTVSNFVNESSSSEPLVEALETIATESDQDFAAVVLEIQARVNIQVREFITDSINAQVQQITATNQIQLNKAVADSIASASEQAVMPSNAEIAKQANQAFVKASKARADTIATVTTQAAAEGAKSIEIGVLNETLAVVGFTQAATKTWVTVGDDKVRVAHSVANGQNRPIDEPFSVMGQLLKHPGDSSLGATAANIINCRCVSLIVIGSSIARNSFNIGLRG
tara:strand:- start:19062 stop:19967 length:906 start_codon:yes stop_codon:yes gene_type:complete